MTALPIPTIGHNGAPEPTPFELSRDEINDLIAEAKHWLDGNEVTSQAEADGVSKLMDMLRTAKKRADERRKEEARPHDEAKAEIQARYNPLIQDKKGKVDLALEAAKAALTPWLKKLDDEKRAKAEAARREAEEKARAAQEAIRAAQAADLEAREKAESLLREAKQAETAANRAANDKAHAKGGARAVTLRTSYDPEITDSQAFARWVWLHRKGDLDEFLESLAKRLVAANVRDIPGVTVHEIKTAV